jgi:proline iminopeptidase
MFVKTSGRGSPLALMHGGPGLDHTTLLPLEPLAEDHTLVFYDQRCNGRSTGAAVESMTWENLTADADALRQALGFERWAVLGHSFGGHVALEYALRYPQNLSHLVLMGTGADQWWVQQHAPQLLARRGYSTAAVAAARRFYSGQFQPGEFFGIFRKFMRAYNVRNNPLAMVRDLLSGHMPKMRPEALIFGYSQLLPGWSLMERLHEIQVPTLVIAGRQDFLFPPEHQAILADRLPNARLAIIEGAGHNPHSERPAEVIQIIRGFLAESGQ